MKILLPVDLVHPIEPTLELLENLCDLSQAELRLLYVRELLPAYENVMKMSGKFSDDWESEVETKAMQALNETLDKLESVSKSVSSEVTSGPTAMMICNVARDEAQELIVMTPVERKGVQRFFAGSVSSRVADNAPCAVLVAHPAAARAGGKQLKEVVVGFDGSENAKQAIDRAVEMFTLVKDQPRVTVVYSVDISDPVKFFSPVEFIASVENNMLMQGETLLAEAQKQLFDLGVKTVQPQLTEGDPATSMIKIAEERQADLIIMGARGMNPVNEMILGSVSHKVAVHAQRNVVVIRPEKR